MKETVLVCLCTMTALLLLIGRPNSTNSGNENLESVELGEYKGVKMNMLSVIVADAGVESRINQVLSQNSPEEESDRPIQEGDAVNVDYVGKQGSVEFAGGTDTGYDLAFGSGRFIGRFENGLIGVERRDRKELNLTLPETYSEEALAGRPVVFEATVNTVKGKKDVVLDDVLAQRVSDYRTVDKYKESIRTDLLKQKQQSADLQVQQSVLQQIVESPMFKLNRTAPSRCYDARIRQYEEQAKVYGGNLSHMAQANGVDVLRPQEAIYASVKDGVRNQLVINTIAEREGIALEDVDRQTFAKGNRQDVGNAIAYYGQETLSEVTLSYKVMKFIADSASNVAEIAETETSATKTTAGATAVGETTAAK